MEEDDGRGGVLGPLIGLRRPRYEVLDDELGWFYGEGREDVVLFVNLGSALRHLFSEYAVAQLTRSEMRRRPRMLAAELVNLAGHYRNYGWKRHGCRTTVLMYHSTRECPWKLAVDPGYKASFYSKRFHPPSGEFGLVRGYVDFNLRVAKALLDHVPNMHMVDTGELDPEAWPWALMAEGRVPGPALVMSGWHSDLQYALAPGGRRGVLVAKGPNTAAVAAEGLLRYALRKIKTGGDLASALSPGHFMYLLALSGDEDLGARGLQKFGAGRAAALVAKRAAEGRLPPNHPNLQALLGDGRIPEDQQPAAAAAWRLLCHADYAAHFGPAEMAAIESTMVNRSGLGALDRANRDYFADYPMNLDLALAGEPGY